MNKNTSPVSSYLQVGKHLYRKEHESRVTLRTKLEDLAPNLVLPADKPGVGIHSWCHGAPVICIFVFHLIRMKCETGVT